MKARKAKPSLLRHIHRAVLTVLVFGAISLPLRAGVVLELIYDGIPGTGVSNLTSAPAYPNLPDDAAALTNGLAEQVGATNDFGSLTEGFIEAPLTGQYTFWIASADDSQFWLSPNTAPAGAALIAQNVGAVGVHNYYVNAAQQSAPISLVEGQKYFFKMLHKTGATGEDHCSVAWSLPNGAFEDPVSADHLWPYPVDTTQASYPPTTIAPTFITTFAGAPVPTLSSTAPAVDGAPLLLEDTIEASQPASVQWYSNSAAIPGANLLTYAIPLVSTALNGVTYTVLASNSLGMASNQLTLSVSPNTTPLTLVDALSLGNPAGDIVVVFSAPVDPASATNPANYSFSPAGTIAAARLGANGFSVLLKTAGVTNAAPGYTLTVNHVQDLSTTPNVIAAASSIGLEQNLNTWLPFDERTGVTAYDASGNGNNGALSNGILTTLSDAAAPDHIGKVFDSVRLDGAGGCVNLPAVNSYSDFTAGLTVAAWIDPTTEGGAASWARIIDLSSNGAASDNILFARYYINDSIAFQVYSGGAGGPTIVSPEGTLATNQWQHVAATEDGSGNVNLYVNGLLVASGTATVPNVVPRSFAFVGRSPWIFDSYFAGRVDDLRLYNRPLSAAAIASLAAGGGADDVNASVPVVGVAATVPTTAEKSTPPGVFTFTRTVATNVPVTVPFTLGGTATNGVDYTKIGTNLTLAANALSGQALISPIDFAFAQLSESAVLTLLPNTNFSINFTNGASDSAAVTILDNDSTNPPTPILVTADSYSGSGQSKALNVWFNEPPASSSATTLTNYTLSNAPAVSLTSATLLGHSGLGVALGLSGPVPTNATLTVSGVQDNAGRSGTFQVPIQVRLAPVDAVATTYHGSAIPGTPYSAERAAGLAVINDDFVNNANNGPNAGGPTGYTGFDTWDNTGAIVSQFVGLLYGTAVDLRAIKVDLGQQFGDGGSWNSLPTVYILQHPVDPDFTRPETDAADWRPVAAQLVSGSQFSELVGPNPSTNTPIVFSLTNLSASARTGYGWAVGGVPGDGASDFISVSELRGYGLAQTGPAYAEGPQSNSVSVSEGGRVTLTANVTSTYPMAYQWLEDGTNLSGATDAAYSIPPAALGDNGEVFSVVASGGSLIVTSVVATLQVNPQSNAPLLTAAAYNPVAQSVDLYFNDVLSPGTAGNANAYTLNDPALSISGVTVDVKGYLATLNVSGSQSVSNLTVSLTNVTDLFGHTNLGQTMPVLPLCWPANNVVADAFQQGRATSLSLSTNGILFQGDNVNVWETFFFPPIPFSFVGLTYGQAQVFKLLKVDLGATFFDGGDFAQQPKVYILMNPVDTDVTPPQTDPVDWLPVPARLLTGNVFQPETDGAAGTTTTNSPITFDLAGLPLSQRTGYGWAVGGVPGNGQNEFLSISELSAFETAPLPPVALAVDFTDGHVILSWPQGATGYGLESSPALGSAAVWTPVKVVPEVSLGQNVVALPPPGHTAFYRLVQ